MRHIVPILTADLVTVDTHCANSQRGDHDMYPRKPENSLRVI